jgi:hypothetical protein
MHPGTRYAPRGAELRPFFSTYTSTQRDASCPGQQDQGGHHISNDMRALDFSRRGGGKLTAVCAVLRKTLCCCSRVVAEKLTRGIVAFSLND